MPATVVIHSQPVIPGVFNFWILGRKSLNSDQSITIIKGRRENKLRAKLSPLCGMTFFLLGSVVFYLDSLINLFIS